MQKRLLFIINPVSGTKRANRFLTEMITRLSEEGYECTVQSTTPTYSAEHLAAKLSKDKDMVICVGGDGTLNETIKGCLTVGECTPPIGYIPAGSTNDFANSLHLQQAPLCCLNEILEGAVHDIDVGTFNGRPFVYTASFGAFTKASYSAPREAKNNLGYLAYLLEGAKELSDIKSYHLKLITPEGIHEGDYIFGGVCNSKRLAGGVIRFRDDEVDLNDGLLEVFLVRYPQNATEFMQLLLDLNAGKYTSPLIQFFSTNQLRVITSDNMDWTIDGEYQKGSNDINISVLPSALKLQY